MRDALVRLHRYMGLATAAFLTVAGLTGAVIAFNHELDAWINPELFRVEGSAPPAPPLELARRLEAAEPRLRVAYLPLAPEPGHALVVSVEGRPDAATGVPAELGYDQVFLHPVTGERLGARTWGAFAFNRAHLVPFLYSVHYSLHLPGRVGLFLLGSVAIVWTIDCFVGFLVTLPPRRRRPLLKHWRPAWQIRLGAGRYRLNLDLHRAFGLWCWAALLTLAVSGVYLNLGSEVFRPLLSLVAPLTPSPWEAPEAAPLAGVTRSEGAESLARAVALAEGIARERGYAAPFDVYHSPANGVFGVGFGDHHAPGTGVPYLYLDANLREITVAVPGEGTTGDALVGLMFPLHSGQIAGLPGRILVALLGLIVATLSVTGVVIWAKKLRGRRALAARALHAEPERPRLVAVGSAARSTRSARGGW